MKTVKFTVQSVCILGDDKESNQWIVSILVHGKPVRTLTATYDDFESERLELASFLFGSLYQQMKLQDGFHFESDDYPFQEELPF